MNYEDSLLSQLKNQLSQLNSTHFEESGKVISYADGMCTVYGLSNATIGELIIFDNNATGIIFDMKNELCDIFLLENLCINAGSGARRTNAPFSVLISDEQLGRVINIKGTPIDGLSEKYSPNAIKKPIEQNIIGIVGRESVHEPLSTGILAIDSMIPIGLGQRQLFLGNKGSGKTTSVLDIIANNKDNDLVFIYVGIGQKQSEMALINKKLYEKGAFRNCIMISSSADLPPVCHYLAPYVGCTIAEYFAHEKKKNVVVIYDDLSKHAVAYRELSLLMRRPASREAYPGDVFYLHSRLLERAGNFLNGGSITAIPIAQLQEDDITAYIPTNLISITDGQVFFDMKLFNAGIKPAVNTELSVSRVGGAAQPAMINKLSKALRLELAQYHELALFSQFGSELDSNSEEKLKRGKMLISLLSQDYESIYSLADEVIILHMFKNWYTELKEVKNPKKAILWIADFIKITFPDFYYAMQNNCHQILSEQIIHQLNDYIKEGFVLFEKTI